jgi:hypothetical protein
MLEMQSRISLSLNNLRTLVTLHNQVTSLVGIIGILHTTALFPVELGSHHHSILFEHLRQR